jgi:D-glycero-beta-D-manno-heptose-7-phosphate kinase
MLFSDVFSNISTLKVLIVGDVMLDSYYFGKVDRISPEAPVPVLAFQKQEYRIGGAGNVALNTVALGATTFIASVIGTDDDGTTLEKIYNKAGIQTNYVVKTADRITTTKTRIIGHNQQMLRLDKEQTNDIDAPTSTVLLQNIQQCLLNEQPQLVILEDYNKGVLTEEIIEIIINWCNEKNIIVSVDPKKKNFFAYKNATIFKPNLKEVKEGLNIGLDTVSLETLNDVHTKLQAKMQHQISFITLSEKGVFYTDGNNSKIIATHIRNIADVSGAGDTVIATASLVYAATKNMHISAEIANIAGGLVCEEVGTAAINKDALLNECEKLLKNFKL